MSLVVMMDELPEYDQKRPAQATNATIHCLNLTKQYTSNCN